MARIDDFADELIEAWQQDTTDIPVEQWMKMDPQEYNKWLDSGDLPPDFAMRHFPEDGGKLPPPTLYTLRYAFEILTDDSIPYTHADESGNCGECWSCIFAAMIIMDELKSEQMKLEVEQRQLENANTA